MLTLAMDTSTLHGRFALADAGQVLVYRPLNVSGSYADALLVVIEEMLQETGRKKSEVKAVGVTQGPGSFTGVRIGVATAKGLAWGLGASLHGVTSLEAMAGALLAEHQDVELAVPVLDARRGEVFCGLFRRQGDWVETVAEPAALRPDAWWEIIKEQVPDLDHPVFGGDGTTLLLGQGDDLRPELLSRGEPALRRWTAAHPATAPALATAISRGEDIITPQHPFALVPRYLRGSDAEVKKNLDLTPLEPSQDISSHQTRPEQP